MTITLRLLLGMLGATAVLIALSILVLGASATAAFGEQTFEALTDWRGPRTPEWPATMDSELRFYAALWLAYGVLALRAVVQCRLDNTPWFACVFLLGGIGRLTSWLTVGAPHPFFLFLMAVELFLPAAMISIWLNLRAGSGHHHR